MLTPELRRTEQSDELGGALLPAEVQSAPYSAPREAERCIPIAPCRECADRSAEFRNEATRPDCPDRRTALARVCVFCIRASFVRRGVRPRAKDHRSRRDR